MAMSLMHRLGVSYGLMRNDHARAALFAPSTKSLESNLRFPKLKREAAVARG